MSEFKISDEKILLSGKLIAVAPTTLLSSTDWHSFDEALTAYVTKNPEIEHSMVCTVDGKKFFVSPQIFEHDDLYPVVNIQTEDLIGDVEIVAGNFIVVPLELAEMLSTKQRILSFVESGIAALLYIKEPVEPVLVENKAVVLEPFRIAYADDEAEIDNAFVPYVEEAMSQDRIDMIEAGESDQEE